MALLPQGGKSPLEILAEQAVQVGAVLVPGTVIISVMLTQRIDVLGNLVDVMMIGFTIDGLPGVFYTHPGADYRWGEAAPARITDIKGKIEEIYALGSA